MLASRFPVGVLASYTRPSKQYAFKPASYLRFDSVIDSCVAFVLTVLVAHARISFNKSITFSEDSIKFQDDGINNLVAELSFWFRVLVDSVSSWPR